VAYAWSPSQQCSTKISRLSIRESSLVKHYRSTLRCKGQDGGEVEVELKSMLTYTSELGFFRAAADLQYELELRQIYLDTHTHAGNHRIACSLCLRSLVTHPSLSSEPSQTSVTGEHQCPAPQRRPRASSSSPYVQSDHDHLAAVYVQDLIGHPSHHLAAMFQQHRHLNRKWRWTLPPLDGHKHPRN
jgi:hypothetical protein